MPRIDISDATRARMTKLLNARVLDAMIACDVGTSTGEVVRVIREEDVRRIPIIENGRLVGLVRAASV